MLDIRTLEAAFAPIGQIGKGEIDVEVDGLHVYMRALTPEEDVAVQKYARGDETDIETIDNLTLIERFKRATLGFSVVQVGAVDLRNVDYIPTGEVLENGVPVRVPKMEAIRRIVEKWSRQATTLLFQQYAELVNRIEDEANAKVRFDTSRLEGEITRLESRLEELRRLKLVGTATAASESAERLLAADAAIGGTAIRPALSVPVQTPPVQPVQPPQPAPVTPAAPTPQVRQRVAPTAVAAPPPRREEPATNEEPVDGLSDVLNSFGDATDEAIAAENARLVRQRERNTFAAESNIPETPVRQGRVPPHMAARAVEEEVMHNPLGEAEQVDSVGGIAAYRLPTTNVTDRGRPGPVPTVGGARGIGQRVPGSAVNSSPSTGSNNPNFRGGGNR